MVHLSRNTKAPPRGGAFLACIVMPRPATGDGGRSCLLTEPCRRDGPERVAWLSGMSVYPCVDGLPAAADGWCIAIGGVVVPVVVAGAGETFIGACAGLFIVPRGGRHLVGVSVAQSCPHRSA